MFLPSLVFPLLHDGILKEYICGISGERKITRVEYTKLGQRKLYPRGGIKCEDEDDNLPSYANT